LREAAGAKKINVSAGPRLNTKVMINAMLRRSSQRAQGKPTGRVRSPAGKVQNFQHSYERYLTLARAEALTGDRIAAENYFQYAEHYFRAMRENKS
jgi:hypothetical protein